MFRWLVNMKVAPRIYDAGVIYLSACLEYIAEELVFRAVTNLGNLCFLLIYNANYSLSIEETIIMFTLGQCW